MRMGRRVVIAGSALLALVGIACGIELTEPRYVYTIEFVPDTVDFYVGDSMTLQVNVSDQVSESLQERAGRVETFSQDPNIARVEPAGVGRVTVSGVSPGRTFVVARLGFGVGLCLMIVRERPSSMPTAPRAPSAAATAPPPPSAAGRPPSRP